MIEAFINEVKIYLDGITYENFSKKYDGLADIVKAYNENGLGGKTIEKSLNNFFTDFGDSWHDYQEEVFIEIMNCIGGFCPAFKEIKLKSYDDNP
jgi:hypothetical protein